MAQQLSHVPKFGNWEGENVPYTAFFENARKEKANGVRINPNDPQENPEVFNLIAAPPSDKSSAPKNNRFHKRNTSDQLKSGTCKSTSSTPGSDKTTSDSSVNSIRKPQHQRRKSDRSQIPPLSPVSCADDYSCRSVAVPKFGEWDAKNPRSADGSTTIFNKVNEEKQIAAAKFHSVNLQQDVNKYHESGQKEDTRGKKCCGLL